MLSYVLCENLRRFYEGKVRRLEVGGETEGRDR